MDQRKAFQDGVVAGSVAVGMLLISLYTAAAPTKDIRARIPYLFNTADPLLGMFVSFVLAGVVALAIAGVRTIRAFAGVVVIAFFGLGILLSGVIPSILPEFTNNRARWIFFGLSLFLSAGVLAHMRKRRQIAIT